MYTDYVIVSKETTLGIADTWVLERVNIGGHWRPYEMIYDDYDGQWYPGIDGA